MAAKNKYICPRMHAEATATGCAECVLNKLYAGDDCAVIRVLKEREAAKNAPKSDPAPKEEDNNPYAVSPRRRRIGCVGIVISTAVFLAAIWSGHMEKSEFWRCVCTIAFIMWPISFYIAFPLLSELVWVVGKGITLGNSQAKALSNLADLDKMLKKD